MEKKIKELRELRRMAEEIEAEISAIQDGIKEYMAANGMDELSGVDYKITWREVKSARLDAAALKKAAPELCARFTKETTTRRFCVA